MKKNLFSIACIAGLLSVSVFSAQAEISQKALQSFRSVFAEAKQVKWTEYPDHYFVSFSQNDMLIKASYDKDGNLLNSTRYYKEQRLPLNILYKVKNAYPSQTIDIVTEVSTTEGTVYFVQLKDNKNWTIIQSDESGNLEIKDKFNKAG
jgi:hypothetical protein